MEIITWICFFAKLSVNVTLSQYFSPDTTPESSFASEAASSVSAALYSYLPFARRRDGRLYTMAKNSYYAYAPGGPRTTWSWWGNTALALSSLLDPFVPAELSLFLAAHSPEMAWTAIAAVVSSIYDGQGSLTNVEAEISATPKSGEVVRPSLATSTSEEDWEMRYPLFAGSGRWRGFSARWGLVSWKSDLFSLFSHIHWWSVFIFWRRCLVIRPFVFHIY